MAAAKADATREDKSAAVVQAAMRGKNDRASDKGQAAGKAVAAQKGAAAAGKKKDGHAKAAAAAAERQLLAENTFADADLDGGGTIDGDELAALLIMMLTKEKIAFDEETVQEFAKVEFDAADTDKDGLVDFDEFIEYYNSLMDRLQQGGEQVLEVAAKKVQAKHNAVDDQTTFAGLHMLAAILSNSSVASYAGINMPFTRFQEVDVTKTGYAAPKSACGVSSRGLILDLSRGAQRIITPWGSLPLGYQLEFPGFNANENVELAEGSIAPTAPGTKAPDALREPEGNPPMEQISLFFELTKRSSGLLSLRKLPKRCHFVVLEILNVKQPRGELLAYSESDGGENAASYAARYSSCFQARYKNERGADIRVLAPSGTAFLIPGTLVTLPTEDGAEGAPLVNQLLGRFVMQRPDKLDALAKKPRRTKVSPEDLLRSIMMSNNNVDLAVRALQALKRDEDALVTKLGGAATRSMVRHALHVCGGDDKKAAYMLQFHKDITRNADFICERRGLHSGLGYPTRQVIEAQLVADDNEEGNTMSALKKQWKMEVEIMGDLLATAQVEDMLSREMSRAFLHSYPPTAEEREHVEELYNETFARDGAKTVHFLTQAGIVLKKAGAIGNPKRATVEKLLREMESDAARVTAFLTSVQNLLVLSAKSGHPSADDCGRYLRSVGENEEQGALLLKRIWGFTNPKPPKPPKKGPPKEHLAATTGFPSRAEAEWALLEVEPKLDELKATALLGRLNLMSTTQNEYEGPLEAKPRVNRADMMWALKKEGAYKEVHGGLPNTQADLLLTMLGDLNQKKVAWGDPPQEDVWQTLEKFDYALERAELWLKAMGTLMSRQIELGVESIEEVAHAMDVHDSNAAKVIELFESISALQKQKGLGNPARQDIVMVLEVPHVLEIQDLDGRLEAAATSLKGFTTLLHDDTAMLNMGMDSKPSLEDKLYMVHELHRFGGDVERAMDLMKNVADIQKLHEDLGHPTRIQVVEALAANRFDFRTAVRKLREAYRHIKDAQLKEVYRENALKDKLRKEEEAAIKAALLAEGGHTPESTSGQNSRKTTPTALRPH